MSLRGIYDRGGVRKQNGHYQSSKKREPKPLTGIYWKDGWVTFSGLTRGYTLNKSLNTTRTLTVVTYQTSGVGDLDVISGFIDPSELIVYKDIDNDITRRRYSVVPLKSLDGEIISTEEYLAYNKKYGWSISKGTFIEPTHPYPGDWHIPTNWGVGSTLYLWEVRGDYGQEGVRYAGLKLKLVQSKVEKDELTGEDIFLGGYYGGVQRPLVTSTEVIYQFIPDTDRGFKLYKFETEEAIPLDSSGTFGYKITFR